LEGSQPYRAHLAEHRGESLITLGGFATDTTTEGFLLRQSLITLGGFATLSGEQIATIQVLLSLITLGGFATFI